MDELRQHNNGTPTMDTWSESPIYRPRRPWGRIAVLLIILGVILFAVGWASGSRGGRVYFENGLRVVTFPLETHEPTISAVDLNFSSNIHTVVVNATSCAIRIIPTSDATPRVTASDDRRLTVNERNGRLYVDSRAAGNTIINGVNVRWNRVGIMNMGTFGVSWNRVNNTSFMDFNFDFSNFSFTNLGNTIRVYVPSTVATIEARSTSGSVRMEGVSTTQLNLRSTSGSVALEGGTHGNTHLQSTSGSVRANAQFAGDIYARSTSGSVNVQDYSTSHRNTNSIQLRSTSGSVRFETRAPITDFRYDLSVTSGSMRVDGSRLDGRRASGGSGNTPITARSASGSVHLDFSR